MTLNLFWQFSRQAQIEQYRFSIPVNAASLSSRSGCHVGQPYRDGDLKSRKLTTDKPLNEVCVHPRRKPKAFCKEVR